jgi:hypothetical protein
MVDACMLPVHPTQPGFRAFDYTVTATSAGPDPVSRVAMYHAAVPTLVTCQ